MDLHNTSATELAEQAQKDPGLLEQVSRNLSQLHAQGQDLNMFISYKDPYPEELMASLKKRLAEEESIPLAGVPVALADNVCTDFFKTTCGSKMLSEYFPPFNARLTELLQEKGAAIAGKTNMEEFGLGCTGNSSFYGPVKNPWNGNRLAGSGAAAAVAASTALLAFASDTRGELRQSASYCGVLALRPSYGRISRRGVIDYASSMEQVGIASKTTADLAAALEAAAGPDPRDPTSLKQEVPAYTALSDMAGETLSVAVPEGWNRAPGLEKEVEDCFAAELEHLKAAGAAIEFVDLEHIHEAYLVAAIISAVEAFSNLANFDGVRFGYRGSAASLQEMYTATRSEAFSSKLKQFLTFGALSSSEKYYEEYYLKSQRMRARIKAELEGCLQRYDLLLTPTAPVTAPLSGGREDEFRLPDPADFFTAAPGLAGLPALSFPAYTASGLPAGLQFIAGKEDEAALFRAALLLEKERSPLKFPKPGSM